MVDFLPILFVLFVLCRLQSPNIDLGKLGGQFIVVFGEIIYKLRHNDNIDFDTQFNHTGTIGLYLEPEVVQSKSLPTANLVHVD